MELSCLVPYTGFLDILMLSLVVMELSCPGFLDVSMSSASSFPEPGMRRLYATIDSCPVFCWLAWCPFSLDAAGNSHC